jgi:outer membrane protein OmpA-like peptidoglycan-associated protein
MKRLPIRGTSRALGVVTILALVANCGGPPRPAALAEADRASRAPAGRTAATLAPEAYAHAEKLRSDAQSAFQNGDRTGAQSLAERALAAYQHALVLSRVVVANDASNRARLALDQAEQAFGQTDAEYKRITAHAEDLEIRANVVKDAMPIAPIGATDASREQARLYSARSLALDARLLCAGAQMVAPATPGLAEAQAAASELDKRLQTQPHPAPIDVAMRCRAQCLAVLSAARRAAAAGSTIGRSDQLLSELSAMGGLSPTRDDRGVAVTLRGLFAGGQLTKEAKERLEMLARVAKAHPDFPVAVVVHAGSPTRPLREDLGGDRDRGNSIAQALTRGGAVEDKIWVEAAGSAHPVLDPAMARDVRRNDRVEIIFIDPGG